MLRILSKIGPSLFKFMVLWVIMLWVFWETGNTFSVPAMRNSFSNPHTIDFVQSVQDFYFPTIVVISFYLNIFALNSLKNFYDWVRSGKIRIGGKAGND